jgi:hypothetical protein
MIFFEKNDILIIKKLFFQKKKRKIFINDSFKKFMINEIKFYF